MNLADKVMKGSSASLVDFSLFFPCSSFPSSLFSFSVKHPLHHFVLEAKVKWVKTGISMMEGWAMKVLRMPRCQHEAMPSSKPGRNIVADVIAITSSFCSNVLFSAMPRPIFSMGGSPPNGDDSASPFPTKERKQA